MDTDAIIQCVKAVAAGAMAPRGMDAGAIVSVSAAVLGLTQLAKWLSWIPDRYGPIAVMSFSVAGVTMWGYSVGSFDHTQLFDYFSAWIAVSLTAAGVYGFSRASGEALTKMQAPPGGAGAEPTID